MNIWRVKEFEGDGISCPIAPINQPFYKRVLLLFFRFGVCPMCMTMSIAYAIKKRIDLKKTARNQV